MPTDTGDAASAEAMVWGISRSKALCATRATARAWPSRCCAALRSTELVTANVASSTSTASRGVSFPAGLPSPRASPSPRSTVQPASSPVDRGGSSREASSGAKASQASAVAGRPSANCAAASAVTATASSSPAASRPRTLSWTGPPGRSGMPALPASGHRGATPSAITSLVWNFDHGSLSIRAGTRLRMPELLVVSDVAAIARAGGRRLSSFACCFATALSFVMAFSWLARPARLPCLICWQVLMVSRRRRAPGGSGG